MQGPRSCTSLHRHCVSPSGEPSAQPPPLLPASPAARRNTSMRGGQPSSGGCMAPAPIRCEERPLHGRAATAPQLPLAGSMGCPRAARPASRYTPLKQLILICLCLHRSYRCRRRRGQGCEDTAFGIHANAARNSSILSLNHLHAHHYLEHTRSCEMAMKSQGRGETREESVGQWGRRHSIDSGRSLWRNLGQRGRLQFRSIQPLRRTTPISCRFEASQPAGLRSVCVPTSDLPRASARAQQRPEGMVGAAREGALVALAGGVSSPPPPKPAPAGPPLPRGTALSVADIAGAQPKHAFREQLRHPPEVLLELACPCRLCSAPGLQRPRTHANHRP